MVCDRDCFNCIYPDCYQEQITKEERQAIKQRDIDRGLVKNSKAANYYEAHKDECKEYYQKNREKILEYQRKRYHENLEAERKRNRERMQRYRNGKREADNDEKRIISSVLSKKGIEDVGTEA